MTAELLNTHRIIWEEKPVLRAIYHHYYQRILSYAKDGKTLEVGGGTGNLKNYLPNCVSTDILKTPWIDATCDAQLLPFANDSFDNIVAVDVLHHIERPIRFLKEAERVLKKGGRLILLEPAITKVSWFFYHFFHPEPVILSADPLEDASINPLKEAFDANQAIPELIFGKYYPTFVNHFPQFLLIKKEYLSLFAYPLSGGFRKWCLIPVRFVNLLLEVEKKLERLLAKHIGFRLLVAIEKSSNSSLIKPPDEISV